MPGHNLSVGYYETLKMEVMGEPSVIIQATQSPPTSGKLGSDGKVQKAKRKHAPKVRTGCLTCKKRRVKCGEEKPHCKRCLTSRTTCDGYATPVPPKASRPLVLREISSAAPLAAAPNSEVQCRNEIELRYFQIYKKEIAPRIGGSFLSKVWDVILLQASQEEVFVLSMLLAISAGVSSKKAIQQGNNSTASQHNEFAMVQYQRALRDLAVSSSALGDSPRKSIISFLLITCFEALTGNVISCLAQAQAGCDVLQKWLASNPHPIQSRVGISSPAPHIIEHELIQAAFFFDLQLLQQFDSRPVAVHQQMRCEGEETIERMPQNFADVDEARWYWMLVQRRASHFVWEATAFATGNYERAFAQSSSKLVAEDSSGTMAASSPNADLDGERSSSLSVSFDTSPSFYHRQLSSLGGNSAPSNFDGQSASLQLEESKTFATSQQTEYTPVAASMSPESMLFDPILDFLSSPSSPSHISPDINRSPNNTTSSNSTPRPITASPQFTPTSAPSPIHPHPPLDILTLHRKYSTENLRWRLSFSHLYSRLKKSSDPALVTAANILFIQSIAAEIQLSTVLSFLPSSQQQQQQQHDGTYGGSNPASRHQSFSTSVPPSPPRATAPLNDYREIVATSRAVVESKKRQDARGKGSVEFVFELGITQALYIVIQHCPDEGLRREAVEVMRWYGCREGAWDCLGLVDGVGEMARFG